MNDMLQATSNYKKRIERHVEPLANNIQSIYLVGLKEHTLQA